MNTYILVQKQFYSIRDGQSLLKHELGNKNYYEDKATILLARHLNQHFRLLEQYVKNTIQLAAQNLMQNVAVLSMFMNSEIAYLQS